MTTADFGSDEVTNGIRVSVEPVYDPHRSEPSEKKWFFLYTVTISNEGEHEVQLMDRHWIIKDETGRIQEVRGPGVVGEQPKLAPGDSFEYTSGCPLETSTGTMRGSYRFVTKDGKSFEATIAEFILSEPYSVH